MANGHDGGAGNAEDTLEEKVDHAKFKAFVDYIHPKNLGRIEEIADKFAIRAYEKFIAHAESADSGLKLYMDPSADGKIENGEKVLDSFLLYLLREFKPKIAETFRGELTETDRGHLKNLIGLYVGLDARMLGEFEEAMKAGGNIRGALGELRGRVIPAYVQKSIQRKFVRYVPEEHTQDFVEYFKKEQGIEDTGDPRQLLHNEAYALATTFIQQRYQPQPSSLESMLTNFKMRYNKPASAPSPAPEPAPAGHH